MEKQCAKRSGVSAEDVVEALLYESVDPKSFALDRLPGILQDSLEALDRRFYEAYRSRKFRDADHADDRAIEMAGEVANDFAIETEGDDFDQLLQRAFKLSRTVRPLFKTF